jgi:hypothetical protein
VQGGAEMGAYATAFPGGLDVSAANAARLAERYGCPVGDQPGFTAEVQAGAAPGGPFTRISQSSTTSDTTVFRLRAPQAERYILFWITRIPDGGAADVNEVRLR